MTPAQLQVEIRCAREHLARMLAHKHGCDIDLHEAQVDVELAKIKLVKLLEME